MSNKSICYSKENMLRRFKNDYFEALLSLFGNRVFAINTRERITIFDNFPSFKNVIFEIGTLRIGNESDDFSKLMLACTQSFNPLLMLLLLRLVKPSQCDWLFSFRNQEL